MSGTPLLERLRALGVKVWAEQGRLRYRGPEAVLTPELLRELAAAKAELLKILERAWPTLPPVDPVPPAARTEEMPLSWAQRRVWLIARLRPDSPAYNEPIAFHLEGPLHREALAHAFAQVVRRHDALRTTFHERRGRPVQRVHAPPADAAALPLIDLCGLARPEREAEARRLLDEEARQHFNLELGPLFRPTLLQLGCYEQILRMTMHHLVHDGVSFRVLARELEAFYSAFRSGLRPSLPSLPVQPADFAVWQQRHLEGEVMARDLAWWRERLAGAPERLELPVDRPWSSEAGVRGGVVAATVPPALAAAVTALSRTAGTTLFHVLLAGWQALLARYGGTEDISVGVPVHGRLRPEVEELIGFFVEMQVLRLDLTGDPAFGELLARVREAALEAQEHPYVPFERLVEELRPDRSSGSNPLFQVSLALQEDPWEVFALPGLRARFAAVHNGAAKFDLGLSVVMGRHGLSAVCEYDASLFDPTTVERLMGQWLRLLEAAAADPDRRLSDLPWLAAAERHQLLVEWNDTQRPVPGDLRLDALLTVAAARWPDHVALTFEENRMTYRELAARAERLASHLRALGVGPEVLVGIFAEEGFERVVGVVAVILAGGAYLPLDPAHPLERLAWMLEDAGVQVLLTEERLLPALPRCGATVVSLNRTDLEGGVLGVAPAAGPDALAYVIYTSGSTGKPNGVMVSHRSSVCLIHEAIRHTHADEHCRVLQLVSFSFDASVLETWMALATGGTLVLIDRETRMSGPALADSIRREGVTTMAVPPPILATIPSRSLPSLRTVLVGGDRCPADLANRWAALGGSFRLLNCYGPTETTIYSSFHPCAGPYRHDPSIGRPIGNTRMKVVDRQGQVVPIGVPGELWVAGAGTARGYLSRPALTAERFVPDPFAREPGLRVYRSGDLVRFLAGGEIEFLGRIDRQVKLRGLRIELGEIEAILAEHPAVRECAVLVRPAASGESRLVAYLVVGDGEAPEVRELRELLAAKLPVYMMPAAFVTLPVLPLAPTGKLDRAALPDPETVDDGDEGRAQRTPVEELVAAVWADVLGIGKEIRLRDSFFALGGHSLLVPRLIARLLEVFGIDVVPRRIFEAPTLEDCVRGIERDLALGADRVAPILPVPRGGELPLSRGQQRLWFVHQLEPESPAYNVPLAFRLSGALDPAALSAALSAQVRRHEALRTRFPALRGTPGQQIDPPGAALRLPVADLSGLPPSRREEEALRLAAGEAQRPFDLGRGPLMRAGLTRLSADENILWLTLHHIVSDGWSVSVLFREMSETYLAAREGRAVTLPPLRVQAADYAVWEQSWLQGPEGQAQLSWWTDRLRGAPAVLDLPIDQARPTVMATGGAVCRVRWPPGLADRLRALGRQAGATLHMVLLSGLDALLLRSTEREDLVVGTVVSNRSRSEIQGVIGFFANLQPLRADLSGDPPFRELLHRTREACLAAHSREELPFDRLVDELQPRRDLAHTPLFQVLLAMEEAPRFDLGAAMVAAPFPTGARTAKYDLTWTVTGTAGELAVTLKYRADLFHAATVWRMLGHFERLLEVAAADPERRLSRLELLSAAEHQSLLFEWNDTTVEVPPLRTLDRLLTERARLCPELPAVLAGREELTFAELDRRANQLARYLIRRGVTPESRVGLAVERTAGTIVGLFAILKAGACYLPLDLGQPAQRLAGILADAEALLVLTAGSGGGLPERVRRLRLEEERDAIARESPDPPEIVVAPEQLAYVLYTSGSTGRPKGVMVRHGSVANLVLALERSVYEPCAGGREGLRVGLNASLAFDASVKQVVQILRGRTLCLLPEEARRDGGEMLAWARGYDLDTLDVTPSQLRLLLATPRSGTVRPGLLLVGGEAIDASLWNRLADDPAVSSFNVYGPTECTVDATVARIEGVRPVLGRPIANVCVWVLDSRQEPVPAGVAGELCVGGLGVSRGYLARPDLTAERFLPNPWSPEPGARLYRTGDRVRALSDGRIEFLGRVDHQVKIRGFRIEPGEIEAALATHPRVREAVVVEREDHPGARRLVAYLVADEEAALATAELRDWLRERLPDYMVPAAFVALERFPLTPNFKVDRAVLPAPGEDPAPTLSTGPRTQAEERLAAIWREVLGIAAVGVHDNFFEIGGDSILSILVVSRAAEAGLRFTTRQIFQYQTLAELAAVAGTRREEAEQGEVFGPVPLTPIQRRFFAQDLADPHHFNQAVLLETPPGFPSAPLEGVLAGWISHHDALRLRFTGGGGGWRQHHVDEAGRHQVLLSRFDLSALPETRRAGALEEALAALQGSLDLGRGPLLRAGLFDLAAGGPGRLLLTIHHLIVDVVSWSILLEDLDRGLEALGRGEPLHWPAKTTSYRHWAEHLESRVRSAEVLGELPFWLDEARRGIPPLPREIPGTAGDNLRGASRQVVMELGEEETRALLEDVPRAYRTRINDALLTAVAEAFTGWTGERRLLVDLEGHGRQEEADDIDLSRTVGWFTAVYPMYLELPEEGEPGASLRAIKEQLRAVPGGGLGYGQLAWLSGDSEITRRLGEMPRPEVSFNYLGRLDGRRAAGALGLAPEPPGPELGPRGRRLYLFEIGGGVSGGRLRLHWHYAPAIHHRETVEKLAAAFGASLRRLIAHCTSPGAGSYTLSDFPLARLPQTALDALHTSADVEDVYPLSPIQHGLLFHTLADPDAYRTQISFLILGDLDTEAFRCAWTRLLERHPALRTVLVWERLPEPHQVVWRRAQLPWQEIDLRPASPKDEAGEVEGLLAADRRQPFDLRTAPLLRILIVHLSPGRHLCVCTHHHLILDGWSLSILMRELFAFYRAFRQGGEPDLGRPYPFRDYIAWLAEHDRSAIETRWRQILAGFQAPTPLPEDGSAPAEASAGIGESWSGLDASTAAALATFARRHQLTLNTLLLGAWSVLLARGSQTTDVVFGTTLSGRSAALRGVESMVGLLISTLPLRTEVRGTLELLPWLRSLQERQVELQQLEASPLVDIRGWSDVPRSQALFESLLVFENYPAMLDLAAGTGLEIGALRGSERTSAPLTLACAAGSELTLRALFDTRRFTGPAIERLLGRLRALLAAFAMGPGRLVEDLPWLTAEERLQVLAWNATATLYPRESCVHDLFAQQAARTPDAPAAVFGAESATYSELEDRAERLARRLRRAGVAPGDVVGLLAEPSVDLIVGMLAVLKAGAAYLPLDPGHPGLRLALMLEDSGAKALLSHRGLAGRLPRVSARVEELEAAGPEPDLPVSREIAAFPESVAYVIYTSGSTGLPKGVCVPHRAIVRLVLGTDYVQLVPEDRVAQASNTSFDAATFEIWGALLTGACLVGFRREVVLAPRELAAELCRQRITVLFLTTALFNQIVREAPGAFSCLRHLLFGGEAVDPRLVRPVLADGPERLLHVYGPTENTTFSTWFLVRQLAAGAVTVPIGGAIANSTLCVVEGGLQPVPAGITVGELCVGGDGLAQGYLRRPDVTAEKLVPDPLGTPGSRMYRTGDLVRRLPGGEIEFVGRTDHQIKIRGFRVELGEIEAVLLQQPGVRDAVVIPREDEPGEKRLAAYVAAGEEIGIAALRAALRSRLPEHMVPAHFVVLPELPLNLNGKVDRSALPMPDEAEPPGAGWTAPRSPLEETIATVWSEVLRRERVGVNESFFDLGGHSLLLIQVQDRLAQALGRKPPIMDLFQFPTVAELASHLGVAEEAPAALPARKSPARLGGDGRIAIVGMAGRFPGAASVGELWRNLCGGIESIAFFSEAQAAIAGVDPALLRRPDYVRARGTLDRAEWFDASFFGYSPAEAERMDPQHRLFLEIAWEALEDAGYDPLAFGVPVGVYAGVGVSTYSVGLLAAESDPLGRLRLSTGSDKDFVATRVSYRLDLHGPSLTVQTACSTSLVAVHLACQALRTGECDMALTGGAAISFPQRTGYLYQEGSIRSRDGRSRPFDAGASGIVGGDGVSAVALKRLEDALADGDTIRAVILSTSVNNDGSSKVGYAAPSITGQEAVITRALEQAGVSAETISFVETHGTGTALGDPIEIAALTRAYRRWTGRRGFCALGAVKANIGHLDAAAGVTGLIKATLAVERGEIPPVAGFERPNPEIDFAGSPFYIPTSLLGWPAGESPRRAGVSSFGLGGTNAHVVLEQAPPSTPGSEPARPWQLLVLSARSEAALEAASTNLAEHLRALDGAGSTPVADLAYTLQAGRHAFFRRRAVLCRDAAEARAILERRAPGRSFDGIAEGDGKSREVVFLLPGHGPQHAGMGRVLYETEPVFREQIDACAERLLPDLGLDLRSVFFPPSEKVEEAEALLQLMVFAQPGLFVFEYALACLWMEWGVRPAGLIGHSLGEYTAACLAGVFLRDDALRLVAARGRLMDVLPAGAMLSVPLPAGEVEPLLGSGLAIAGVNGPSLTVVSGQRDEVVALEAALAAGGIEARRLRADRAFHSWPGTAPMHAELRRELAAIPRHPPRIPFVSNLTGTWIEPAQAVDPEYWIAHLSGAVLFSPGLERLLDDPSRVLLEVGPGSTLSTLAARHPGRSAAQPVIPSLGRQGEPESSGLTEAAGRLWVSGVTLAWPSFQGLDRGMRRRRVPAPVYPFERRRYMLEASRVRPAGGATERRCVVLAAANDPARRLAERLERAGWKVLDLATAGEDEMERLARELTGEVPPPEDDAIPAAPPEAAAPGGAHARPLLSTAMEHPATPTERLLAEIWQELLGIEPIGRHDNYFELGGDSVLSIQIMARARACGVRLNVRQIFECPTIAELALLVVRQGEAAHAPAEARSVLVPLDAPEVRALLERVGAERVEDVYPLSPLQHGIVFHGLLEPESRVYVHPAHCTFVGDLDPMAFVRAWDRVVERNPILRTSFAWEGLAEPLQIVHRQVDGRVELRDWQDVPPGEREERIVAFVEAERRQGFDLASPPLWRLYLIRFTDREHHFVWMTHHVLLDGWSMPLIFQDLLAFHSSLRDGRDSAPPLRRPYRDYISWMRQQDLSAAERFWREELRGVTAPTTLPAGGKILPGAPARHGEVATELPEAVSSGLEAFVRRHRLTLNTLIQGAWALLLARESRSEDVLFGATVSGRPAELEGVERMVGLFINTLPVRATIDAAQPLARWLEELQERQGRARHYEHCSLVQVQEWSEVPARLPLFESILVFESFPADAVQRSREAGLDFRPGRATEKSNSYPLILTVKPGQRIAVWITYDRRRIESASARRLLGFIEELLAVVAEATAAAEPIPVGEILAAVDRRLEDLEAAGRRQLRRQKLGSLRRRASLPTGPAGQPAEGEEPC